MSSLQNLENSPNSCSCLIRAIPRLWLCLLSLGLVCRNSLADFRPSDWQFSKVIMTPAQDKPDYVRVALDGEVYGGSQLTLADLRIVTGEGSEIPFGLLAEQKQATEEEFIPRIYNRAIVPKAYSTLTLDLGQEVYHNKLILRTPSQNFKRRVEIWGSPNGKDWMVLRDNAYIFDFSGEQKIQLTRITYPETNHRYLQVRVWNGRERPLELEEASVFYEKTSTPTRSPRNHNLISHQEDAKLKATVCVMDLGYPNLPWDYLTLATPEENFSRLVEIQGSNDGKEWRRHLQSEFYRFRTPKYDVEKKTFQFPEARHRYVKVIIYNFDDPPLRLEGMEVQGSNEELVFQAQPDQTFWLYYGNPLAVPPRYDMNKTKNYLNLKTLPSAKLAQETANRSFNPKRFRGPWTEAHPALYWGILIFLVLSLGTYILRLLTKAKINS
jgi:hypothetical protein